MRDARVAALGLLVAAVGFSLWALAALGSGVGAYLWVNVLRLVALAAAAFGVGSVLRGGSPKGMRAGFFGLFAAACVTFAYNATSRIAIPDDLSTVFGFLGGAAAAYGARNWYGRGDALAAAWVTAGLAGMAANPGTYVLLGVWRAIADGQSFWQGGWMPGSLLAMAGLTLAAATFHRVVETSPSGAPAPNGRPLPSS